MIAERLVARAAALLVLVVALVGCAQAAPSAPAASLGSVIAVLLDTPSADAGAPDAGPPPPDAPPPPVDAPPPQPWTVTLYDGQAARPALRDQGWGVSTGGACANESVQLDRFGRGTQLWSADCAPRVSITREAIPRRSAVFTVNYAWVDPAAPDAISIGPRVPVNPLDPRWGWTGFTILTAAGCSIVLSGGDSPGFGWADGSAWIATHALAGPLVVSVDSDGNAQASIGSLVLPEHTGCLSVGSYPMTIQVTTAPGAQSYVVLESVVEMEPVGGVVLQ